MGRDKKNKNIMITAKKREQKFRKELQELLDLHGAEIEITDDGRSYGMQMGVCKITMGSVWKDSEFLKEYCEFNL